MLRGIICMTILLQFLIKIKCLFFIPFRVCIINTLQQVSLVYDEYLLTYSRKRRCPMLRGIICMTILLQFLIKIKCLFLYSIAGNVQLVVLSLLQV